MSSTYLLIDASLKCNTEIIWGISFDSQILLNKAANLFYRSPDFCIFLLLVTRIIGFSFSISKKFEKETSTNVLNFLEKRISNLNFKFTKIP